MHLRACVTKINFDHASPGQGETSAKGGFFAIGACAPVKEETSFFPHTSKAERLGLGTIYLSWCQRRVTKTRIPQNTYVPRQSPLEPHKQRPVHALPCCARVVVPRTDLDRGGGCCFRQKPWRLSLWGDQGPLAKRVEWQPANSIRKPFCAAMGTLSLSSRSRDRHDDLVALALKLPSSPCMLPTRDGRRLGNAGAKYGPCSRALSV